MSGIHLHPHDIQDEGTNQIFRIIKSIKDIKYIFPQVNTIFERNPYPQGRLPHNPVHEYVQGKGTLHVFPVNESTNKRLYQKIDESILEGTDSLDELKKGAENTSFEIIPWVNLLNGDFQGQTTDNNVLDFRGHIVDHWLCPNGPDVVAMWTELLIGLTKKYGYTTYMIDRIRFPDWAGKQVNPQGIFSCFCQHCKKGMISQNIDVSTLIAEMQTVARYLKQHEFDNGITLMMQSENMKRWIKFRKDSVSSFVERLLDEVHAVNPDIRLWLDLWPPSYAWLLGQDYGRLTHVSKTLKHFPYHKLGGGADVQGLIEYFADTEDKQEEAFQAFLKFFDLKYEISYRLFKKSGYPISFVKNENNKVRMLSQTGTKIFSGIQMWNIDPTNLIEAIEAAHESDADDVIYYCYGWADTELFSAIRDWNEKTLECSRVKKY